MNTSIADLPQPQILIVDDTPENLQILFELLTGNGYLVRPAPDGEFALNFVRLHLPDLILLDIRMPGLDGYEVCRQLKADEQTREIPVIFLSALGDIEDKIQGFDVGGVDYITKPFHAQEVLARVNLHLTLRRVQQALQQEVIRRRQTEELLRAANASKDKFFSILAHDLRTPFNALLGLTEVLHDEYEFYSATKIKALLSRLHTSSKQVYDLLQNLLDWSRLQRGLITPEPEDISLSDLIHTTIPTLIASAERKQIALIPLIKEQITVHADVKMIQTVIRNLLSNALKFTNAGGTVTVSARQEQDWGELVVADTGIGIRPEDLTALFRIDAKTTRPGTAGEDGTGLGLILCKELVEQNGGTIHVESELGKGSRFIVKLPCQ